MKEKEIIFSPWLGLVEDTFKMWTDTWQQMSRQQQENAEKAQSFSQKWTKDQSSLFNFSPWMTGFQNNIFSWPFENRFQSMMQQNLLAQLRFAEQLLQQWSNLAEENLEKRTESLEKAMEGWQDSPLMRHTSAGWFREMTRSLQQAWMPMLPDTMQPREALSSVTEVNRYINKAMQLQLMMLRTGLQASIRLMNTLAKDAGNGQDIRGFEDFYKAWSSVNEKEFVKLFESEAYINLQNDLQEIRNRLVAAMQQQMPDMGTNAAAQKQEESKEEPQRNVKNRKNDNKLQEA